MLAYCQVCTDWARAGVAKTSARAVAASRWFFTSGRLERGQLLRGTILESSCDFTVGLSFGQQISCLGLHGFQLSLPRRQCLPMVGKLSLNRRPMLGMSIGQVCFGIGTEFRQRRL